MDVSSKLVAMLGSADTRKRIAAAVVAGELGLKDAALTSALVAMGKDPLDPCAGAALEALGLLGTLKALPVLLDSLTRAPDVRRAASEAIARLGPDALPEIRGRLADATPEIRAALSQLLPAVGGRLSFEMALEGMRGQGFDAVNKVALSVRQEMKTASAAERKVVKGQLEKFLAKKSVLADEPALRGALKMLGYLEAPELAEALFDFTEKKQSLPVRMEAVTALRFILGKGASAKQLRRLIELMEDGDALVARAARDTLTVVPIQEALAPELARLVKSPDLEVAKWAISHLAALGGAVAEKTLFPVVGGADRTRAEAAAVALAGLPRGTALLCAALAAAEDETGAQVLSERLTPLAKTLPPRELKKLVEAGRKGLEHSVAVARRILEPVREADPQAWREVLAETARKHQKKDAARAGALFALLTRSAHARPEDRYAFALMELSRSPLDVHPRARQRDPALEELNKLVGGELELGKLLPREKSVSPEALFYLGFHFAEGHTPQGRALGATLLEHLVKKSGRTKLGKAAKNKLTRLEA